MDHPHPGLRQQQSFLSLYLCFLRIGSLRVPKLASGRGNDDGVLDLVAKTVTICGYVVLATAAGAALRETKYGEGRRVDGKGEHGR